MALRMANSSGKRKDLVSVALISTSICSHLFLLPQLFFVIYFAPRNYFRCTFATPLTASLQGDKYIRSRDTGKFIRARARATSVCFGGTYTYI